MAHGLSWPCATTIKHSGRGFIAPLLRLVMVAKPILCLKGGREYDDEFKTPVFLTANNLKPFIFDKLIENSKRIFYYGVWTL